MSQGQGGGRPTEYNVKMNDQVYKLCLLGFTDKEIADFYEVTEQTINGWKIKHPKFFESITKGKQPADGEVARRLYERALGFEHDSEEIKVVSDGAGQGSSIERVKVRKVYPPDTAAAIFWLKNRQKSKWRDKVETGFTDSEGNDMAVQIIQLPDNGRKDSPTTE